LLGDTTPQHKLTLGNDLTLGNWALHTAAIVLIARLLAQPRRVQIPVGIAWAAASAIVWELAEYVAFVPNSPEAATAYRDTLGDLALGLLGGTIATLIVAFAPPPRRS